jgi:hypothetical protein
VPKKEERSKRPHCLVDFRGERGRLVARFDCKGCAREADLASSACWNGVMEAITAMPSLDSIVLAGYVETEYTGAGLEALESFRRVGACARRAGVRAPPSDDRRCASCTMRPSQLFSDCASNLSKGADAGLVALRRATEAMMRGPPAAHCQSCFAASEKDLAFVWNQYRAACGMVLKEAYGIVEGSE